MKKQLSEIKRMQQLAGIMEDNSIDPDVTPSVNTSDEKRLDKIIVNLPTLMAALKNINNTLELDGLFKIALSNTSLKDISKAQIMSALLKALRELEPNQSTVTTVVDKNPQ